MADYQAKNIPIFPDVNDVPIAPTTESGGNISHFYNLYNQLVDDLEVNINDLEDNIATVDEIAGDGFDIARNLDARVYDYYYYHINPNKNYIIFQNNNTTFNLGTHNLGAGSNSIGNIPANGELFRIIAEGNLTNFQDIRWEIGGNFLLFSKVADYLNGAIWWFYDTSQAYSDPFGYSPPQVTKNDVINVITNDAQTNISFKLEMTVYSTPSNQVFSLETFEFPERDTVLQDGINVATIGTIPKTGKLQQILIDNIADGFNTYFSVDGGNNVLSFDDFRAISNGYLWIISDDGSQSVTQGQELIMQAPESELGFTVTLYIYG